MASKTITGVGAADFGIGELVIIEGVKHRVLAVSSNELTIVEEAAMRTPVEYAQWVNDAREYWGIHKWGPDRVSVGVANKCGCILPAHEEMAVARAAKTLAAREEVDRVANATVASKGLTIAAVNESIKKVYSDQGLVSEAAYRAYGKDSTEPFFGIDRKPAQGEDSRSVRDRILKIMDRGPELDDDTIVATVQKLWDGYEEYRDEYASRVHNLETSLAVARNRANWMADALQDKDERIKKLERELGRYLTEEHLEGRL